METKRYVSGALESLFGTELKVHEHGFIRVVDYMGGDADIAEAARQSNGKGTKKVSDDISLIRYLLRNWHTSPFEMCEIKFHIRLPIFVARQWIRHRMANVNEYSARYSILSKEFYLPEKLNVQSKDNKQGRGKRLDPTNENAHLNEIELISMNAYDVYQNLLNEDDDGQIIDSSKKGIARELARMVLPTNYYTEWYWKVDLHNLLHFLRLRNHPHAQKEIRDYAEIICDIVSQWCPATYQAFLDYRLNAVTLSAQEVEIMRQLVAGKQVEKYEGAGKTEWKEFMDKFGLVE